MLDKRYITWYNIVVILNYRIIKIYFERFDYYEKIMSTIIASAMTVSAITAITASAINVVEKNSLSVSTETVDSAIIVEGTKIPAGAVAVTVNVSNNAGFSSSSTNISLGNAYTPITDENDMLVVESGSAIGDSFICGSANGELVNVATASGEDLYNGEMFTFYVSVNALSDDDTIEIVNTESENISSITRKAVENSRVGGYYCVGDVNNDGSIDSSDSSFILAAEHINNDNKISIAVANANLSYYFPNAANIVCAQAANPICNAVDSNSNGYVDDSELRAGLLSGHINDADAQDVLTYYSLASTGQLANYENRSDGFCGRILHT